MNGPAEVGFYGKLPSHGDFITRRLSRNFLDEWDAWLQRAIAASKADLGEQWLDIYLTSPIWSFALGGGICGTNAWAGVLMPSVDRVGRYFPLTLVAELHRGTPNLLSAAMRAELFFGNAERLMIETLESEHVDLQTFDERLLGLAQALDSVEASPDVVLDSGASAIMDAECRSERSLNAYPGSIPAQNTIRKSLKGRSD